MKTSAVMKKRIKLFFVSLVFILIALVVTFSVFHQSASQNVLFTGKNIFVTFESKDKGIQFGNQPMSYEKGALLSPANIYKIVNKSKLSTNYEVRITDNGEGTDKIDVNKLVVSVNDEVKSMSDVSDTVVYEGFLNPREEKILDIRLWLDEELVTDTDKDKSIKINVEIKEK